MEKDLETQLKRYHVQLLPYAYNILGDCMGAEDVVQEVLNNYFLGTATHIQNTGNYLIRSVINKAINEKKRLNLRKGEYPGQWLPSPVSTEEGIYALADRDRILDYSLLVLLERLNPRERAVFILVESFDHSHSEVAGILDITIENSRQLLKRARQKLKAPGETHRLRNKDREILRQLAQAILQADVETVKHLLSEEVRFVSDGGGQVRAARNVIHGKDDVYKLLKAIYGKYHLPGTRSIIVVANHRPTILFEVEGHIYRCIVFDIGNDTIRNIYTMVNPEKLKRLSFLT